MRVSFFWRLGTTCIALVLAAILCADWVASRVLRQNVLADSFAVAQLHRQLWLAALAVIVAAIVVVGIGITLFAKVQKMTNRNSATNSRILMAGKMIEKHLEDTRILYLRGHVRADKAAVSTFATDQAVVNTRTGVVSGPRHQDIRSSAGRSPGNLPQAPGVPRPYRTSR